VRQDSGSVGLTTGLVRLGPRTIVSVTTLVLVASVALNVLLAYRVRDLATGRSARAVDYRLKTGTVVPAIEAKRLDGKQSLISYKDAKQPTVLYVFTPPCIWCARNMDNFKTLLDQEKGNYRFIGVSLSETGLAEYVGKNALNIPVYSGLSPETRRAYKLGSTPQTIVVSADGEVLQDWAGAYVGEQQKQIEAFFHVTLPGLRELPNFVAGEW
jgi:peroxiredoxin